jgi:Tfp pilus assembly protein PilN
MNAPVNVTAWEGFNLLPWRLAAARRLRRRRAFEWLAALLIGAALGCAAAGWQAFERTQADARRTQIEQQLSQLGAPLREARRLAREADERHAALREAQQKAKPLTHLFALIEALARVRTEGVVLDQLIQHTDETELQASATDEAAAAAWLERLHALRDIEAVNVREMKREAQPRQTRITTRGATGSTAGTPAGGAPIHVAARLVWKGAAASGQTKANAIHSVGAKEAK